MTYASIKAAFDLLESWEDRYAYLIELGEELAPLRPEERNGQTKVEGCVSLVWLVTSASEGADPIVTFRGDSDALIVRGLIAIVLSLFSEQRASVIAALDARPHLAALGLDKHLTPQRSNGLASMLKRIKQEVEPFGRGAT